ncbi:kinase-like domain-containing protein [Mycena amicta]|nr:kinase-like domain-containing protein [Mycena amicta]
MHVPKVSYDHALITGKRNDRDSGIDFTITALTNKTKRLFLISSSHSTSMSYPAAQPLRDKDHISIPQYSPERVPTTLKFYDLSAPDRKLLLRDYTPSQHKHSSITNENNTFQVFKRNGKYYAVKQLIANTREGVLKAEKEIMAMQRLSTETGDCRVAPFHDYFFNQDQTYDLIFEYFPGMTLRFLITSRHGLSEKLTKHLMRALLDTVMELHKLQILHCHLTSENVLVDVDGKIQIVNFGSSIYLDGRPALAKGALSNPADTFAAESPFRANPITVSQPFTFSDDVSQCGQICWECFAGDRLCTETTVEQCVLGQDKEQNDITLSTNGRNFVLNACVGYFPTAKSALQHPWFSSHDLADKYTRGPKMF